MENLFIFEGTRQISHYARLYMSNGMIHVQELFREIACGLKQVLICWKLIFGYKVHWQQIHHTAEWFSTNQNPGYRMSPSVRKRNSITKKKKTIRPRKNIVVFQVLPEKWGWSVRKTFFNICCCFFCFFFIIPLPYWNTWSRTYDWLDNVTKH